MSEEMIDMTDTVVIKSDQLNSEDLAVTGPRTIMITGVKKVSDPQQPIHISFKGDDGKPWKPNKGMRVIMITKWGKNAAVYKGRKLTIYNDSSVKWAGEPCGGIRISHMDNIDKDFIFPLTISKGKKVMHKVKAIFTAPVVELSEESFEAFKADIEKAESMNDLKPIAEAIKAGNFNNEGQSRIREVYAAARDKIQGN